MNEYINFTGLGTNCHYASKKISLASYKKVKNNNNKMQELEKQKTKEFVVFLYFSINKRMHFRLIGFRKK